MVADGYVLYENTQLAIMNELALQYVNSHYLHPYEILEQPANGGHTWAEMRDGLKQQLTWLSRSAPGLRSMTAKDAATATQRYERLKINAKLDGDQYVISLGGFYDRAFLMLRTSRPPQQIEGGKFTQVTSSLYLVEADQPDIRIQLGK